jgi:hypothetical protein
MVNIWTYIMAWWISEPISMVVGLIFSQLWLEWSFSTKFQQKQYNIPYIFIWRTNKHTDCFQWTFIIHLLFHVKHSLLKKDNFILILTLYSRDWNVLHRDRFLFNPVLIMTVIFMNKVQEYISVFENCTDLSHRKEPIIKVSLRDNMLELKITKNEWMNAKLRSHFFISF